MISTSKSTATPSSDRGHGEVTKADKMLRVSDTNPASINRFKRVVADSGSSLCCIEFMDCNVERLLDDSTIFKQFSQNHCSGITSLIFEKCHLNTGRFFEIIAYCKNLIRIQITDSPSIFNERIGVGGHVWPFDSFQIVLDNLGKVKQLLITDGNLKDADVWALTKPMKSLQLLAIRSTSKPLPMAGINKSLENVSSTLTNLHLSGQILGTDFGRVDLDMPNLETLVLERCKLQDETSQALAQFLKRCYMLREVSICESNLHGSSFLGILDQLYHLHLSGCTFFTDTFTFNGSLPNLDGLTFRLLVHHSMMNNPTAMVLKKLLQAKAPELTTLMLELQQQGDQFLSLLSPVRHPKLESLSLVSCNDIAGQSLRGVFRGFPNLRHLSIENSNEICDESLISLKTGHGALKDLQGCLLNIISDNLLFKILNSCMAFSNQTELETLSLCGTNITNKTISQSILHLKKLESVNLSHTKVDKCGIEDLVTQSQFGLRSLNHVELESFTLTESEYKSLRQTAPKVEILCQIVPDQSKEFNVSYFS